jgi:hypothetical protein
MSKAGKEKPMANNRSALSVLGKRIPLGDVIHRPSPFFDKLVTRGLN